MAKDKYYGKTLRKNFARHEEVMAMPNLLAIQKNSYQWFLDTGLREVFADVASITDYAGNLELSFLDYSMNEQPKYDVEECKARDATYAAPMKVSVRLHNKETGEIKEQEIFMGDFPLMTESGTFVINGAERVVVSQIVRSPGIYYGKEIDLKTDLPLLTQRPSSPIAARGWSMRRTPARCSGSVSTRTASSPSPVSSARSASRPMPRSSTASATIRASLPPSRRTPARPMRRPCWRSTASSAPASRPRSTPPRR